MNIPTLVVNAEEMTSEQWVSALDQRYRNGPKRFNTPWDPLMSPMAWYLIQFKKDYIETLKKIKKGKEIPSEDKIALELKLEIYNKEILPAWQKKRDARTFIGNFFHSL